MRPVVSIETVWKLCYIATKDNDNDDTNPLGKTRCQHTKYVVSILYFDKVRFVITDLFVKQNFVFQFPVKTHTAFHVFSSIFLTLQMT